MSVSVPVGAAFSSSSSGVYGVMCCRRVYARTNMASRATMVMPKLMVKRSRMRAPPRRGTDVRNVCEASHDSGPRMEPMGIMSACVARMVVRWLGGTTLDSSEMRTTRNELLEVYSAKPSMKTDSECLVTVTNNNPTADKCAP